MSAPLEPLSKIIKKFDLRAKKSLGQNYLLDSNLNKKIAAAIAPSGEIILEIGPGPGSLTRELLNANVAKVFCVELDGRFVPALNELKNAYPNKVSIIQADALKIDPQNFSPKKIVGNLPFNIVAPLLTRWLLAEKVNFQKIIVLVQKEVALRMVASPNNKSYGRLSLLCGWRGMAKILFYISARAFTPVPKVDAALVEISLNPNDEDPSPQAIEYISRLAFSTRRKMLRTHKELVPLLDNLSINPRLRAEQISIEEFRKLAKSYKG